MSNLNLVKTVVVQQVFAGNSFDVQIETLKEKDIKYDISNCAVFCSSVSVHATDP